MDARRSICPIACTLDLVGDRWTLLVLRDLFLGKHHYDEFAASDEEIASNVLADRLKRLEAAGMIEAAACEDDRRRKRYALTALGRSFQPILEALARWGLEHLEGTEVAPQVRAALARKSKR